MFAPGSVFLVLNFVWELCGEAIPESVAETVLHLENCPESTEALCQKNKLRVIHKKTQLFVKNISKFSVL